MNKSIEYPRFRWLVLIAVGLGSLVSQANMIAFTPLLGDIATDLGITLGAAVHFMAIFLFSAAIALIVGGILVDRKGIFFVLIIGIICTVVPAAIMPVLGHTYGAVLVLRLFQGLSIGLTLSVVAATAGKWFPANQRGLAVGIPGACISLGTLIGVLGSPLIFASVGNWQLTMTLLSILGWIALVYVIIIARMKMPELPVIPRNDNFKGANEGAFKRALSMPVTWIGVIVTFCIAWVLQSMYDLTPSYFAVEAPVGLGFGSITGGQLVGVFQLAGMFGPLIAGLLIDRVFRGNSKPVLLIGFLLTSVFYAFIQFPAVYDNRAILLLCLIVSGMCLTFLYPAIQDFIAANYPVEIIGRMTGLWMGIGAFGGAVGLLVGATTLDSTGNYVLAINLIALAGVVGFLLTFLIKKPSNNIVLEHKGNIMADIIKDKTGS